MEERGHGKWRSRLDGRGRRQGLFASVAQSCEKSMSTSHYLCTPHVTCSHITCFNMCLCYTLLLTIGDVVKGEGCTAGSSTSAGHPDLSLEIVCGSLIGPQLIRKTGCLHNQHIL